MKTSQGKYTKPNIWDYAKKLPMPEIDPGVRFFVFVLNRLGLTTEWSCEGHPGGFYVIFRGSYRAALKLKRLGYLTVEVEGPNRWSVRITMQEGRRHHVDHLRHAAAAWEKLLSRRDRDYLWSL